jgi:hypothetical protein
VLDSNEWQELWAAVRLARVSFADLGVATSTSDRVLWNLCQARGLVLITGNRNHDGPDSLDATLSDSLTPTSLPVMTIGDPDRVSRDGHYAATVVADLIQYLFDIRYDLNSALGTGRLYLPKKPL